MIRALHIGVLLLCVTAAGLFVKINSLPMVDDLISTEASIVSHINQASYEDLKRKVLRAIKSGSNSYNPRVVEARRELEKMSEFADVLLQGFESVESGDASLEVLEERIISLEKLMNFELIKDTWNESSAMDSSYFLKPLNACITKLRDLGEISDRRLRKLMLQNIRQEVFDLLHVYIDELFKLTDSFTMKFDTGFPHREKAWKKGLIAFNPPANMELNEKERIQIRISKDLHIDLLKKMPAAEAAVIDSLLVGDAMIVRLTGDDFDIVAFDEEEQGVTDDGYTQWEFDVTPKSTGTHALFVKAGIVYSVPGLGPTKKFFPVYEKQIQIHVNTWKRIAYFATERWEFLISSFLIPAFTWAWTRFRKKKAV